PTLFPADYDPRSLAFEDNIFPYATALAGACPWLGIEANLLPAELRKASSRARLIPTVVFAVGLIVLLVMLAMQQSWADARYLALLQGRVRQFEPSVKKLELLDRNVAAQRARAQSLDDFRRRSRFDIDSLAELTKLIPSPGWITSLDMDRQTVQLSGEADQAAPLLEKFDSSAYFERSEFTMPITRGQGGEMFRIRTQRTVPVQPAVQGKGPAAGSPATAPAKPPANAVSNTAPNPAGGAR
ncbi:MAG: PilN domain-containing protein, partial [Bryobacteraceae bacterium]|nr:PilN domain-containing protein [Bryobacteraceae bacterium]